MPSVATLAPADSFGNRFPLNQADSAGASPEATPPQPERDDSVEPPALSPAPPRPLPQPTLTNRRSLRRSRKRPQPNRTRSRTKSAPLRANASHCRAERTAAGPTETAATEPPAEQPAGRRDRQPRPREQASQEPNPDTQARRARRRPRPSRHLRRPTVRPPTGTALPPRRNVRARRRTIAQPGSQPARNRRPVRAATAPPCRQAAARPPSPRDRSTGQPAFGRRRPIRATHEPLSAGQFSDAG